MKPYCLLLSQVFLLCLLPHAFASNPDSEIFQDSSDDDNETTTTVTPDESISKNQSQLNTEIHLQHNVSGNKNASQKTASRSKGPRSMPGFYNTGSFRLPVFAESKVKYVSPGKRDRGTLLISWGNNRNNRTYLVGPGHDKAAPGSEWAVFTPGGNGFDLPATVSPMPVQGVENRKIPSIVSNSNSTLNIGEDLNGNPVQLIPQNPQSFESGTSSQSKPETNFFASIVNDFAFKLIETANLGSNFFVSPLSIFVTLSMCYLGSEGNTKVQIEQALGLSKNAVQGNYLHQGISDLLRLVSSNTPEYQLLVANGMFLGKSLRADDKFVENMKKYYGTELINLDFGNPDLAVSVINNFVRRNTRNMITGIIPTPPSAITRLLLLNAIFFKGIWKTQFPVDLTYKGRFNYLDGKSKEIPTMALYDETLPFYKSEDHRHSFLKLPYAGDQVSMIIALPHAANEEPMPAITDQILRYVRNAMREVGLNRVAIPKFRMENKMSLRRPLLQLGISDIFSSRAADLRKLRQQKDIYVSAILHKALIEVDEQGTTAAASTGVKFVPLSYRNTTSFVADHPFAFYIVHEPSGLVLFYSKVFDFGMTSDAGGNRQKMVVQADGVI